MSKKIAIIGIPMDFGQQLRGVDMGPSAVRYTGLISKLRRLGHQVEDLGDIRIPIRDCSLDICDTADSSDRNKEKYVKEITQVCESVYSVGKRTIGKKQFPLFIGGDHSIAVGTVSAVAQKEVTGLIWIDAHADFNTPTTSPSGNIHGMPLSVLLGEGPASLLNVGGAGAKIEPENVVLIGQRDIDPGEKDRLRKTGMTIFTMRDIDEQGISAIANKAMMKFMHLKRVHLTLDMDALDPVEAPGVGTPVPGGITYREAHLLMEIFSDSGKITSMDLVEINPILDVSNKTAQLAVELILSAMGKSIL
jgi:arginase